MATTLGWITLALPLAGALILALLGRTEPPKALTRAVGLGTILIAFVLAVVTFAILLGEPESGRSHVSSLWEWIDIGGVTVDLAIQVDTLSVMMMLIITGVGFLIHLYSAEYMDHDRDYRRFFAEMNFFVFSMLLLVLSANFLFLIVGWAFVGIASYLLIGYYYDRPPAVAAAKKAFVINVIGDVGMVLAAFLLVREFGTLDYGAIFSRADELGPDSGLAALVCLLLFVGAAAKSAQVPLHTWLPDAMEGPTPVSALIHAATMVTAGVYLVVRTNALFDLSSIAGDTVAITGAVTLLLAATVATVQVDIKRVLAWSTVSQIGYMIMAAGLAAYGPAMFHLLMHAFFKALLFLAVGIVIHAIAGEQSLDRMGALRKPLQVAWIGVLVGCLAISGIPPFSGFFSKDEILAVALTDGGAVAVFCWVMGTVGAGLTAFYMFRLYFRAFHGPGPAGGYRPSPHPSKWWMAVPVMILAVLATFAGWIQVPGGWQWVNDWIAPVLAEPETGAGSAEEWISSIISISLAAIGIAVAWWLFAKDPERRLRLAGVATGPRGVLSDAYRFDAVYDAAVVDATGDLGDGLTRTFEAHGAQGIVSGTGEAVGLLARALSAAENGLLRTYALAIVAGVGIAGVIVVLTVVP